MIKAGLPMKNGLIITPSTYEQAIPFGGYTGQLPSGKVGSLNVTAGNNVLLTLATTVVAQNTAAGSTPTKEVEVSTNTSGIYRISFDLYQQSGYVCNGQIYKNGVPYGTLRNGGNGTFITYTEDLSFNANDLIQLYLTAVSSATRQPAYQNFKIMCALNYPNLIVNMG